MVSISQMSFTHSSVLLWKIEISYTIIHIYIVFIVALVPVAFIYRTIRPRCPRDNGNCDKNVCDGAADVQLLPHFAYFGLNYRT